VIKIEVQQLPSPTLEFGGAGEFSDPKVGLREAGPYDLRFGAAHRDHVKIGLVGPRELLKDARRWFERCEKYIPSGSDRTIQRPGFPGFKEIFRGTLLLDDHWTIDVEGHRDNLAEALSKSEPLQRFDHVLDLYAAAVERLADLEMNKPDVVLCCLPTEVITKCFSVTRRLSHQEKAAAKALKNRSESRQLSLFDLLEDQGPEELEEDLLNRDFRRALKARALRARMPIQIATRDLLVDQKRNQDPATRAWNSSVAIYYKAGGIPWRFRTTGPESCFVGVSFHHLRTTKRHLVISSIAQAFSSEGEGFALRGQSVPWDKTQGRQVHLTEEQAYQLGVDVLDEYRNRTGGSPLRVVLHKTSAFDEAEETGFKRALRNTPVVEFLTLTETPLRLIRFGAYPPRWGTMMVINDGPAYLFTSGFVNELGTYPGPHIPAPMRINVEGDTDLLESARDVLGLTRMNWNTASLSVSQPVTLSFARRIGGIMDEYGDSPERPLSSFRFYI